MSLAIQITTHAPEAELVDLEDAVIEAVEKQRVADAAAGRPLTSARIFGNDHATDPDPRVVIPVERSIVPAPEE